MSKMQQKVIPLNMGMVSAYLVVGEGIILIDTGYPKQKDLLMQKIKAEAIDPKQITLILITHGHSDHYGCAQYLKEQTDAPVAVHKLDAENLRRGTNGSLCPRGFAAHLFVPFASKENNTVAPAVEADIEVEKELDLSSYGIKGKAIWTPGHTAGSMSVLLESKEAIIGDLAMAFIGKSKPKFPMFANDVNQIKNSMKQILSYDPQIIYAGHGGPFSTESIAHRFLG
jgi:hydroxyacylglutathione hydrolase